MNILDFKKKKEQGQKISMLTCYDYTSACIIAESNIDCVLIGDSVSMTMHGFDTTVMATMEMMILHTKAVSRGLKQQFIVSDLPFLTHKGTLADGVECTKQLLQSGANSIKIEGADPQTLETIHYLTSSGVPVMGHIGLTPQHFNQLGGFKIQGKTDKQAELLHNQAKQLELAGCFALVVECIPYQLAKAISQSLKIPAIGIGAGPYTDGQVLVWQDLLGLQTHFKPKFVKHYAQGKTVFLDAINQYHQDVSNNLYPCKEHSY